MAYITRMTRAFMIEALSGEYIITARAKGLSSTRILWRHAFGNISVRLITVLALAYAGLLEGAVITETVFSWPGLGLYLTVSLLNADMNAVLGATLVVGAVYLLLNLMADMAYHLLDPRVRMSVVLSREWLLSETPVSRRQAAWVRRYRGWLQFRTNGLAMVGLVTVVIMIVMSLAAPLLALQNPSAQDLAGRLAPPSLEHWFGTDELGRDIYSRILYGGRVTLGMVVAVVLLVAPIGLAVGSVAGYLGGMADRALMRVTDIFLAFPRLVLALAFVAALKPGITSAIIAIALTVLAALCAPGAGRDADRARQRLHRRGAADRCRPIPDHPPPHRAAVPVERHRARHAGHERHHPDRGRRWASWAWARSRRCRNGAP